MLQGPYLLRTVRVKAFIKMVSANKDSHFHSRYTIGVHHGHPGVEDLGVE